jgi:hypothetical protein
MYVVKNYLPVRHAAMPPCRHAAMPPGQFCFVFTLK